MQLRFRTSLAVAFSLVALTACGARLDRFGARRARRPASPRFPRLPVLTALRRAPARWGTPIEQPDVQWNGTTFIRGRDRRQRCGRLDATVAGGFQNGACNFYDVVAGGYQNDESGTDDAIAGGDFNLVTGAYSTIGGGYGNATTRGQQL